MLDILHDIERQLPSLLRDGALWNSLFVDYHPPFVERLWRQHDDVRIYLHRIHPCGVGEALFHPHPWPSAMKVLDGTYEMAIGYGTGNTPPPHAARLILPAGSEYEMKDLDSWHYVRPLRYPSHSLMVTGKPWDRPSPKSDKVLEHLVPDQEKELIVHFRKHYPLRG